MAFLRRRGILGLMAGAFSSAACKILGIHSDSKPLEEVPNQKDTFDYIVVGSGAGGGPLAVNLAKAGFKTLLLEAGTDQGNRDVYKIPAFHTQSSEDPEMSWDFFVRHFESTQDDKRDSKFVPGKGILYPRAGTLGGCTAHNAMIFVAPLQSDWQQLADELGDSSYHPRVMRRFFQLCERAEYLSQSDRKRGWLPVRLPSPFLIGNDNALLAMLFAAAGSLKSSGKRTLQRIQSAIELVTNPDCNADTQERDQAEGLVMIPVATTAQGQRYSTRDLILTQKGKNLELRTGCLVTKVLFADDSLIKGPPQAIGVEMMVGEKAYKASKVPNNKPKSTVRVYAKKEVILAGGTFNTPQLLMLSGIGPKKDLARFSSQNPEYRVILDRPGVGLNLQDRYEVGVVTETSLPLSVAKDCEFKSHPSDACYLQWLRGSGPYTANGSIIGIRKKSAPQLSHPDLFIFLLPTDFHGYFPKYSDRIANTKNAMTWCILKSHTHNRGGQVKLKSLDPTEMPDINFNYFQDGTDEKGQRLGGNKNAKVSDLEAVVSGVEFVREIIQSANGLFENLRFEDTVKTLLGANTEPYFDEVIPGYKHEKRDALREWVRDNSWGHHASGTCKMGRPDDPMAVVDSRFRVIGTQGLRIVDASIFPRIPGYFIVSSIYTMSERASDEILADAGRERRVSLK